MQALRSSAALLLPRAACAGAVRWMGRAPLFWRSLPPPPGYMPRAEPVQFEDIGMTYLVHSGKDYRRVKVTAAMVGHKYGEFVLTRKVRARVILFHPLRCRTRSLTVTVARNCARSATALGLRRKRRKRRGAQPSKSGHRPRHAAFAADVTPSRLVRR